MKGDDLVPTIAQVLREAKKRLKEVPFGPSMREAGLLLRSVLGWSEAQLLIRDREVVEPTVLARFTGLLERRLGGEPMAYVLGEREFWGRSFAVDPRVLIPRPETEHLVDAVLGLPLPSEPRILDIGTGSGCIAVTLALECPTSRMTATDLSLDALQVAAANGRRLGASVRWVRADLASALQLASFDLVVSNPPYIDPAVRQDLSAEVVDHEPGLALFASVRGRGVLERLLDAGRSLKAGAWMVCEIGYDQEDLVNRAVSRGGFTEGRLIRDYAGHPRTIVLRRGPEN